MGYLVVMEIYITLFWTFYVTELNTAAFKLSVHLYPVPSDILSYPGMQKIVKRCLLASLKMNFVEEGVDQIGYVHVCVCELVGVCLK